MLDIVFKQVIGRFKLIVLKCGILKVTVLWPFPAADHSYFEKVMEQLQQVAAQEEQESNRGNSVSLTDDEEAQLNPETNVSIFFFTLHS